MAFNSQIFKILSQIVSAVVAAVTLGDQLLAQAPSESLKQADAAYREGVTALNRNELRTAQTKFEETIRLAPSAEQGHSALGAVLQREGHSKAAIVELQKALTIKADDSSAELNLAAAYSQSGEPAKAVPLYARVIAASQAQKRPLAAGLLSSYARALVASGQSKAAVEQMKKAVAADPGNLQDRDFLGSLYAQVHDWSQAEHEFTEEIRRKPDLAIAHMRLGFVLQAEQKPAATQEWLQAAKLDPKNAALALLVGKALADAGQDTDALPILEQAHALAAQDANADYQLAVVLQRVNRVDEAIPLFKSVVEAQPANADALINLGLAFSQAHNAREGVPYLQRAVQLKPDSVTAHQDLAAAYLQDNETEAAIVELKTALNLVPDSSQLHYDLGTAYRLQDDSAKAIPELELAEKLDPTRFEPNYVLGVLYLQQARYEDAATRLEASLKLHPQNGDAWATLGSVYNKLERLPEAVTALQEAIRQLPNQADPHLTLATVLVKQNHSAQAAAERKAAANLMRTHMNNQRAEVATNSGKSLLKEGKLEEAAAEFRSAIGFDPDFAEAHAQLADVLDKQGKSAEASAERQHAKALENVAPNAQSGSQNAQPVSGPGQTH